MAEGKSKDLSPIRVVSFEFRNSRYGYGHELARDSMPKARVAFLYSPQRLVVSRKAAGKGSRPICPTGRYTTNISTIISAAPST